MAGRPVSSFENSTSTSPAAALAQDANTISRSPPTLMTAASAHRPSNDTPKCLLWVQTQCSKAAAKSATNVQLFNQAERTLFQSLDLKSHILHVARVTPCCASRSGIQVVFPSMCTADPWKSSALKRGASLPFRRYNFIRLDFPTWRGSTHPG